MKEPVLIGRPPLIRQTNAQILLNLFREKGPCSKADLVRASGLSAPSVTNVVAHLAQAGLVEPIGEGDSTGGRPPDILRFRAERGCVAGIEVGADSLHFLLCDLSGRELGQTRVPIEKASSSPSIICKKIGQALRELLAKHKQSEDQLLGLAVGVPAIVNVNTGTVVAYSALQDWNLVNLGEMLAREVKCQVTIENDTNLAAQGEHYCGAAQSEQDFIFMSIGTNVGAGIVLGGKIHHGSQWSAGEIAYLRLPHILRRQPTIHEFGELEAVLTSSGILKSWYGESRKSDRNTRGSRKEMDAIGVLDLAQTGDARAQKIVRQRADIVSDIIVNLSLILNPGLVLLGGEIGSHPILVASVLKQLEGSEFAVTRVGTGALGPRAVLWGAISLAMNAISSVLLPQPMAR